MGLVVTKAYSPTTPPATQIITGKGVKGTKMLSSIPLNGMTYAETLRGSVNKKGDDKIPHFEPPVLE